LADKTPAATADNYRRSHGRQPLRMMCQPTSIQIQTDRMPVEDAPGVEGSNVFRPSSRSPWRAALPGLRLCAPTGFRGHLSYNPWHCLADHRPLGNQNRTRKALYQALSQFRQRMNDQAHIEPVGDESFPDSRP
jgi:hypothetical protein